MDALRNLLDDAGGVQVGGMVVPEDVAVKWWLTKKREKRAKENAIMVSILQQLTNPAGFVPER